MGWVGFFIFAVHPLNRFSVERPQTQCKGRKLAFPELVEFLGLEAEAGARDLVELAEAGDDLGVLGVDEQGHPQALLLAGLIADRLVEIGQRELGLDGLALVDACGLEQGMSDNRAVWSRAQARKRLQSIVYFLTL